jgi:hypothetical protein
MTSTISSIVAGTMAATGPLLLAGTDPTVAMALMSTLQGFYYMLFFNVNYPENIESILNSFAVA